MLCVNSMLAGHEPKECVDFLIHGLIVGFDSIVDFVDFAFDCVYALRRRPVVAAA